MQSHQRGNADGTFNPKGTLTRAEVSGGGIKPWRQKGTGRARSGDNNSPVWVGGGNVFGPKGTQNWKLSQNKKAHNLALCTVLSEKTKKGLIVVDDLGFKKVSTKELNKGLSAIKAEGKTLLVLSEKDDKTALSARNIATVKVVGVNNVSVYDVLNANNIVISKENVKKLEEGLK